MEMMNKTMKIMASHFASVNENPAINPNPKTPATIATTKNISAQNSQPDNPFLFMFILFLT